MQYFSLVFCIVLLLWQISFEPSYSRSDDLTQLGAEQASEKSELEQMHEQLKALKDTTSDAMKAFNKLDTSPLKKGLQEFHLFCRSATREIIPGQKIECLTYNGLLPGPPLRVKEGQLVRIIVHNQLDQPTSFHLHGMILPESVDGLPNSRAGLIKPGQTYAYQFLAKPAGTYWYHPQLMHNEQKAKGMYGAFIVERDDSVKAEDQDIVLMLGDTSACKWQGSSTLAEAGNKAVSVKSPAKPIYLINGKTAPDIPNIEVQPNTRVLLRVINAAQHSVPLHITGHSFKVLSANGNPSSEQVLQDTISVGISSRVDLEFTANNPGIWSIGSELVQQSTVNGKFPGGIACVIRYVE